jgi:hypothetical protein
MEIEDYDIPFAPPYKNDLLNAGDRVYRADTCFGLIEEYEVLPYKLGDYLAVLFVSGEAPQKGQRMEDDGEWFLTARDAASFMAEEIEVSIQEAFSDLIRIKECIEKNQFEQITMRPN